MNKIEGAPKQSQVVLLIISLLSLSFILISIIVGAQMHGILKKQAKDELVKTVSHKASQYTLIFKHISEELKMIEFFTLGLFNSEGETTNSDKQTLTSEEANDEGCDFKEECDSTDRLSYKELKFQYIGKLLEGAASSNAFIQSAFFVSPEGSFVSKDVADVIDNEQKKKSISVNSAWYKAAVLERRAIWTEPYVDAKTNNQKVTIVTPIFTDQSKLIGIVGFDVSFQKIKDDVLNIDLSYDSYSFLISTRGKVLASSSIDKNIEVWSSQYKSENLLETTNLALNHIVGDMVKKNIGFGVFKEKEGTNNYLAYAPLEYLDVSVGVIVKESEILIPSYETLKMIGIVAILIFLLVVFYGVSLRNNISVTN